MEIFINQRRFTVTDGATVAEALNRFGAQPPYAVALNGVFVHRGAYETATLSPSDRLEVVQPVAGG